MSSRRIAALASAAGMAGAVWLVRGGAEHPALGLIAVAAAAEQQGGASKAPPPLVVDEDAPLLLDEPTEADRSAAKKAKQDVADNSACFVCHENYKVEPLARVHAKEKIGCVDCHGDSFAHRNDENNTTPPERMYPARRIDRACKECHETHDVPALDVLTRWKDRGLAEKDPKRIVCTDCHGQHRLRVRTVRWNKKTGELIVGKKDKQGGS